MTKSKVAMIVPNPCNPDFRVVKQAEALARSGREVRIYCTRPRNSDLPERETINGVVYIRKEWVPRFALLGYLRSVFRRKKPRAQT